MKLDIENFMDFPMILKESEPEDIELIISDIPKDFMLSALKYLQKYSQCRKIKITLKDPQNILEL